MARTADEGRRAEARRLYASGARAEDIAARLGVRDRRTVQRWCADIIRPRGPRPNPAVSDERIVYLREVEGLSYAQIAAQTDLASWTSARNRYYAAKGLPRDGRREPPAG